MPIPIIHDLENYRILVYEKHPMTRLALNHILSCFHMRITEITDPDLIDTKLTEAKAENDPFALTLIGINQPDPNSKFLENILDICQNQHNCPVGVLANSSDQDIFEIIQDVGVAFYLSKPVRKRKLREVIYQTLLPENAESTPVIPVTQLAPTYNPQKVENQIRVLTVDDYPANLKLVSALLDEIGVIVKCATSGEEALSIFEKENFDLILMDIQMPHMDGIEVTNRIRAKESSGYHIPIVAVTAHALSNEKEAVLRAGMDGYLTKPINENDLQAIIHKWAKRSFNSYSNATSAPSTEPSQDADLPLDWQLSLKLAAMKPQLAKEMLLGLTESLSIDREKINNAFSSNDLSQLHEHVHRLHGACCYCGVPQLKAAAQNLETAITEGNHDKMHFFHVEMNKEIIRLETFLAEKSIDQIIEEHEALPKMT